MNACQFFLLRYVPVHRGMIENIVSKVTDAQMRTSPIAGVNTIAWLLWHMARTEDLMVNRFVAHQPQLFFEERWADRLNVLCTDFGVGMTPDEVRDLSARVDLDALQAYWSAVEHRTRSVVEALSPEDLDEVNESEYIYKMIDEDGMLREAAQWAREYLAETFDRSKGSFLGTYGLTHNWGHYNDAAVVLGLLGIPGR